MKGAATDPSAFPIAAPTRQSFEVKDDSPPPGAVAVAWDKDIVMDR